MPRSRVYGNSFFSERQHEILRLRNQGLTPDQIASKLGVTRQDVSILERRMRQNLEKAFTTINLAVELDLVHRFSVAPEMYILEASNAIFSEADRLGIKLQENYLSLAMLIRSAAGTDIEKGKLEKPLTAFIGRNGRVTLLHER